MFHIDGGGTLYPRTPYEKYIPPRIVQGPIIFPNCKICGRDMRELRKEEPKSRALRFCSSECYDEAKELHRIWKKLKAETLWWPLGKPPIDKRKLTYTVSGEGGISHHYNGRKPRAEK